MSEINEEFIAQSRKYLRADFWPKIESCLQRLTDEQIWWRPHEEANSIGNLLLHLAGNVRQWIVSGIGGAEDARVRQAEFDEREHLRRDLLIAKIKTALDEADAALASFPSEQLSTERLIQGRGVGVLEAVYHVVEHFSMHTGQIILMTKMLTGGGLDFYVVKDGLARRNVP